MISPDLEYCVAIRTLGKAGAKYQQELDSLKGQTIPPRKIIVYIAEGYPLPKETIGTEQYVYVKKGMVAQRALRYDEVDTEYVLLLDDDVCLAPDSVERLFNGLQLMDGDAIAADTFHNHDVGLSAKVKGFITNWSCPRRDDQYAFKVQRNASFSYNNHPTKDVYLSESAAGPASLWKTDALRAIHFEDELWMDRLGFAYGDDLLFYNKLVKNGGRLLVHYNCGIVHLDAQSERKQYASNPKRLLLRSQMWFILWWRTCYDIPRQSFADRALSALSFSMKCIWNGLILLAYSLIKLSLKPFWYHLKGTWEGWKFVHGDMYAKVPNFILNHKT